MPTDNKHSVPKLLISMIERTVTSKKNAIPPHVSPSTTVYRIGGRGVTVGTGELVGEAEGVREGVAVGLGDPVGVSAAPAGKMVRLAANVRPAETSASTPTSSRANRRSRLTVRRAAEEVPCAAALSSVPQTTQREAPGVKRVPQVGHKDGEASLMGKGRRIIPMRAAFVAEEST